MTDATHVGSTNHLSAVGTIEDLGPVENLPVTQTAFGAGRTRHYNPFDTLVRSTYETGKPRLAVADNLTSARVLIRRAAEHAGLGVDIVQTVAADGRAAVAYLARDKRPKAPKSTTPAPPAPAPAVAPSSVLPTAATAPPSPVPAASTAPVPVAPSPTFDDQATA